MAQGSIAWVELTTKAGATASRFYAELLDVPVSAFRMGAYEDYSVPADGAQFGICHPRSSDDVIPPGWIVYLQVSDIEAALERAQRLGALILSGPKHHEGIGTHAVIRDPTGATTALFQAPPED